MMQPLALFLVRAESLHICEFLENALTQPRANLTTRQAKNLKRADLAMLWRSKRTQRMKDLVDGVYSMLRRVSSFNKFCDNNLK